MTTTVSWLTTGADVQRTTSGVLRSRGYRRWKKRWMARQKDWARETTRMDDGESRHSF